MRWDSQSVISVITAIGFGGILKAIVDYFKDRKKRDSDTRRSDVDTKLAYLNAVIVRLDEEAKRVQKERDDELARYRAERELMRAELNDAEQRNADLRRLVRELQEEIDDVRKSAQDTQHKCDDLANRLKELVDDAQEEV